MRKLQISSERKRAICLIGMDGTGKTAHSRGLIDHLHESGIKCKYVWFGHAYFFSFPFMVICRMLGLTTIHHMANGLAVSEHKYYKNNAISEIWPWIQFLDAVIFVNLRVRLLLWRGFTVVCDRFIPDIVVELMTDVNDDDLYKKLVGRLMLRLMPHPLLVMSLDVDEKIALQRRDDVPGIEYLSRRRNEYRLISRDLRIPIVNAEEPFPFVQQHLVAVADRLNWKNHPEAEPKTAVE